MSEQQNKPGQWRMTKTDKTGWRRITLFSDSEQVLEQRAQEICAELEKMPDVIYERVRLFGVSGYVLCPRYGKRTICRTAIDIYKSSRRTTWRTVREMINRIQGW